MRKMGVGVICSVVPPWLAGSHGKQWCCALAMKQLSMAAMVTGFVLCKLCSEAEEIAEHQEQLPVL